MCKHKWKFAEIFNRYRVSHDDPFITYVLLVCENCGETKVKEKEFNIGFHGAVAMRKS